MFKTIEQMKQRDERGFTLIELLIVIAIIAILAAIAIPQFAEYRKRAMESAMVSDVKNAATTMESIFSDCQGYTVTVANGDGTSGPVVATLTNAADNACATSNSIQNVAVSAGDVLTIPTGTTTSYTLQVYNANARANRTHVLIDNAGHIWWN